ncbi:MAG: hypothetical protein ACJ8KA_06150, partial [Sulfurifustis sp.]
MNRNLSDASAAAPVTDNLQILRLAGGRALSDFRRERLLTSARTAVPRLRDIEARYWHFVAVTAGLTAAENATLARLLQYGPQDDAADAAPAGELLLVLPRLGTISPWSSKATDIVHHCGLAKV